MIVLPGEGGDRRHHDGGMTTSETSNVRAARPIGIAFGYLSLLPHPRRSSSAN